MTAFFLIAEYTAFENSFDHSYKNSRDLYRITTDRFRDHKLTQHSAETCSGIGKLMQENLPDVLTYTRALVSNGLGISYQNQDFEKLKVLFVDSSFLSMFSYTLLAGNSRTALQNPNSIVLTEHLVKKMFGNIKDYSIVIGKTIRMGRITEQINGVCESPRENSSIQFDLLNSYNTSYAGATNSEINYGFSELDFLSFVQLTPQVDYKKTQLKLDALVKEKFKDKGNAGYFDIFHLQPLEKIHFSNGLAQEVFKTSSSITVWGLFMIGLFILIIAWINYINTSVARSMERAKEISIRKISGASSFQLIKAFFSESLLVNGVALIIAMGALILVQKSFNDLVGENFAISQLLDLDSIRFTLFFFFLFVAGLVASALYPALVLTNIKPTIALKGLYSESLSVGLYRKMLVIIQLTITMALVSATIIVYRQMLYISQDSLGYEMSEMLVLNIPGCTYARENAFMDDIRKLPNVKSVASSKYVLGDYLDDTGEIKINNSSDGAVVKLRSNKISQGFIETYGMKLKAGRSFDQLDCVNATDSFCNVLLNEKAVNDLNFKSPTVSIGKLINIGRKKCTIIGVISNFHQQSYYYPIEPTILFPNNDILWWFSVKLGNQDIKGAVEKIKDEYKDFFPGFVCDYYFVSDYFNSTYRSDAVFTKTLFLFSGVSIFLSALGLFSLSLFYSIRRGKEMSIRKILGASAIRIIFCFLEDFFYLTIIAFFVSLCLTWFLASTWLNNFVYRVSMDPWIFIISGVSASLLIIIVTSFHTVKTALENPIKRLRTE